jgi:hypothetical protein
VYKRNMPHLETLLAGLDGSNVTGNTTTNDDQVLLLCAYSQPEPFLVSLSGKRTGLCGV